LASCGADTIVLNTYLTYGKDIHSRLPATAVRHLSGGA
jgi:hypothetical protein